VSLYYLSPSSRFNHQMAKPKQIAHRVPSMTPAQQRKKERDEERIRKANEKELTSLLVMVAKVMMWERILSAEE